MRRATDPTELILLRLESIVGSKLLVVDPFDASALNRLCSAMSDVRITALCRDYRTYLAAANMPSDRLKPVFGLVDDDDTNFDSVLVYMPKGKDLLSLTLDWLAARMPDSSAVYLTGDKHSGVSSCPKMMPPVFGRVAKLDSARHCLLYRATKKGPRGQFDFADDVRWQRTEYNGSELDIARVPGVFSFGRVDDGTAALAQHLQLENPRTALDIGCGDGLLGGLVASRFPSCQVTMTDVSAPAIWATRLAIDRNKLRNARCYPSDLFDEIEGSYDVIMSNPPFHTGHDTDRSVTERLVRGAATHLNDGGSLQIVGNRFLPYRELLGRYFGYVRTLAEDAHYVVCLAREPRND